MLATTWSENQFQSPLVTLQRGSLAEGLPGAPRSGSGTTGNPGASAVGCCGDEGGFTSSATAMPQGAQRTPSQKRLPHNRCTGLAVILDPSATPPRAAHYQAESELSVGVPPPRSEQILCPLPKLRHRLHPLEHRPRHDATDRPLADQGLGAAGLVDEDGWRSIVGWELVEVGDDALAQPRDLVEAQGFPVRRHPSPPRSARCSCRRRAAIAW